VKKVEIRTLPHEDEYGDTPEEIEIYVDGEKIADGFFGGEPEDNIRCRDYAWVDKALKRLAEALGAEVSFVEMK